ncbi:MAG: hypothetical protein LBJ73_01265 [Rickettsiales bacterium]|nr:hypothetical protein [Rickettsiales bacterium]
MNFHWTQDFNIICGTPCIGKTTMGQKYDNVIDLMSSPYKFLDYNPKLAEQNKGIWTQKNPNFIRDYVRAILSHSRKYALVLLSMNEDLFVAMDNQNIKYAIAYSPVEAKQVIEQRFIDRGNDMDFVKKVMSKFESRAKADELRKCTLIKVLPNQFIEQALANYQNRTF